jgi:hypothetical protein
MLLFSPNSFSAGSNGLASLPSNTSYISIASGSSLVIKSSLTMNFAVIYTSKPYSINVGNTTVNAFTCCLTNNSSSASGEITVSGPSSGCDGFQF